MSSGIVFRLNDRPAGRAIADLRESVTWDRREEDYPGALDNYDTTVAAYDEKRNLVGWCAVVTDGVRHAFFVDVIVHPDWQRKGVGTSIVQRAIEEVREKGIKLIHVDFAKERAPFYAKCGFDICGGGIIEYKD